MRLHAIILNWNAAPDTIECVRRLQSWQIICPEIWVVDNDSEEQDYRALETLKPEVHLLRNARNLGFAGGTNRGIETAHKHSPLPLLLLNNDAQIDEENLLRLLEIFDDNSGNVQPSDKPFIGIVGPLLYETNTDDLISAGYRTPALHLTTPITTIPSGNTLVPVDYVSGSVALIRPQTVDRIGLLDEAYFFNTEVADYCRRAAGVGIATVIHTNARAYHNVDRSRALRNTLYTYYIVRNRLLYIRKFYGWRSLPLLFVWSIYTLLLGVKMWLAGERPPARAALLALYDGLSGRYGGQNERVLESLGLEQSQTKA